MWHMQLGDEFTYDLRLRSGISAAKRFRVRPILGDEKGKHHLIVGAYNPKDLDRVGEIIAVVRTEDVGRTYFQTWDAYSLGRAGRSSTHNIESRRDELEQIRLSGRVFVTVLTQHWRQIRTSAVFADYYSRLMSAYGAKLLAALTTYRLEGGEKIAAAVRLEDSRDQLNPRARCAQIVASMRRLEGQLELDAVSLGSVEHRAMLGELLSASIDDTLVEIDWLMQTTPTLSTSKALGDLLGRLAVKPYTYALRVIDKNGYTNALHRMAARERIVQILFTERMLGQVSALLSIVRDNPAEFVDDPEAIRGLAGLLLVGKAPTSAYEKLFVALRAELIHLMLAHEQHNAAGVAKTAQRIKKLLRYRDTTPLNWPKHNTVLQMRSVSR